MYIVVNLLSQTVSESNFETKPETTNFERLKKKGATKLSTIALNDVSTV